MSTTTNLIENIRSLLQGAAAKQIFMLVGIAASVAMGMTLYVSIKDPIYRPLDYQVTAQNLSSIVDTLDKAGVQYKINDSDGLLYVAAKDVQMARMRLASAGVTKDDSFNFSYLNDQAGIGNSQFLENARYVRALESDLAKTISALEGVSAARVHIAIPQNNIFADENQRPTASVVVNAAAGLSADKEKIRAIVQIIASSVPGLDPNDVAITDQYGHYLSSAMDKDSIFSAEQMTYQNNLQNYYEKRIESMLAPILGDNKVNVRVNANLDFTQQEEAKEQYDPEKKVIRSEQTESESNNSSGASGAPGALANSPPESDGEKGGGAGGGQSSSSGQSKSQSTKNYEVDKSVRYIKSTAPKVVSLSVAVVLDNTTIKDPNSAKTISKPIPAQTITKITDLVKATIGFDEKRGDKVTVVNSSFTDLAADVKPVVNPIWQQPWFFDWAKRIVGIILGFIFMLLVYRRISKMLTPSPQEPGTAVAMAGGGNMQVTQEMSELKQEQILRLKELASKDPERVSLILKNWVGKE